MKRLIGALLLAFVAGCANLGYQNMTAEQIRATAGTTTCTQFTSLYGKASNIAINADETRKGATSTSDLTITCGEATMSIKASVGAPVPPGATTTTTTTVVPAK
jgi:hypothetical protein